MPTRELALQVAEHAAQLSRDLRLRIATIYGGVGYGRKSRRCARASTSSSPRPAVCSITWSGATSAFTSLQVLVLDEADRMLDIGFLPDIRRIVRLLPRERQTMLFSATLQPIVELAREVTRDPVRVEVEKTVTPDAITQALYPVPEHLKFQLLQRLLEDDQPGQRADLCAHQAPRRSPRA